MSLNDLKIGSRMMLGFGGVLLLLAAIVLIAYAGMVRTDAGMAQASAYQRRVLIAEQWVARSQLNASRTIAIAKASGLPQVEAYYAPLIKGTSAEISALQKELEAGAPEPEAKAQMAVIAEKRKAFIEKRRPNFTGQ